MLSDESTGVESIALESCEMTSSCEYLVSMAGLNISTLRFANLALFNLLMSSSVLPENIDPQITSMLPALLLLSKNISVAITYGTNVIKISVKFVL